MLNYVETCWNMLKPTCHDAISCSTVCCGSSTFPSIWLHTARHRSLSLWKFNLSASSPAKPTGCFNQGVKTGWWVDFFSWCLPWLPRSSLDSRWYAQRWGTENLGSRRRAPNFPCDTSKGDRLCPCANAAWPGKFQAVTSRHVVAKLCRSKLCGPLQPGPAWSAVIAMVCGYGYLWITTWKLLIHINWKVVGESKKWSATGFLFINGSKLYGFHCFPLFSYGFLDILVNQLIKHHVGKQIHQFSANMSLGLGLALRCYRSEGILNRGPLLVGVWATPLKNMSSSVGMMTFPIGKS